MNCETNKTELVSELRERLLALGYLFAEEEPPAAAEETATSAGGAEGVPEGQPGGEQAALELALRRARSYAANFANLINWEQELSPELREVILDLAAAYFLQAKMALAPDSLTVLPTLTSLRMGDAAWSFGGGTQRSGTDALSRAENLAAELRREARAALCAWRSL